MDFSSIKTVSTPTTPAFQNEAESILSELKRLTVGELAQALKCSDKIAMQCHIYYNEQQPEQAAIYSYSGDVYSTLKAVEFDQNDLEFAQNNLLILSALYGVVRPFDTIQPYRLDFMGKFSMDSQNLYKFWQDKIENYFEALNENFIINLASTEYSKLIKSYQKKCQFVTPNFYDKKNGKFKIVSSFAKKARGAMANWIIKNKITDFDKLVKFDELGYQYNEELSKPFSPIFARD